MNKRTKILAAGFGVIILYAVFANVVYPKWVRPWFTLDQQIVDREKELDRLLDLEAGVAKAREEYRGWVERVGSFDSGQVLTDVRDRLNQLIEKHHLEEAKVTPNRVSEDRKSGLVSTGVTVTATGNLESAMNFMKDVSELPHLIRVLNPSFSPASSGPRDVAEDRLNIKMPIEIWVLPQHKVVERIDPEKLVRPEFYVRHQGRDYSPIWTGQPFADYVPLRAQANPASVQVQTGQTAALNVSATGGHGSYKYEWTPTEGLTDPDTPTPQVDTAEPGSKRYTVTVTDATGHTAQVTVAVNVKDAPVPVADPDKVADVPTQPKIEVPKGPKRWPHGNAMELRMALLQRKGDVREDEFMLFDTRNQSRTYVGVGGELDGGTLIYVHQRGGVTLLGDQYLVYPLGLTLDRGIPAESAQDYPELQRAATFHRNAVAELSEKNEEALIAEPAPGLEVAEPEGPLPTEGPTHEEGTAEVTAAPPGPTGTSEDGPPAGPEADGQPQAEQKKSDRPAQPATKRRPARNRRPK